MYAIDFEYDGRYLSEFGYVVCNFNSSSGTQTVDAGSQISFEKVSRNSGRRFGLAGTKYDECLRSTIHICKNPEIYSPDLMEITHEEFRELFRWLNRREFLKFQPLNWDEPEWLPCYFNASFNVSKILIAEKLYGLELTLETDAPFGYGEEAVETVALSGGNDRYTFEDLSDEIGFSYPYVQVTCKSSGNLVLTNDTTGCSTTMKNCSNGEVITLSGDTLIVESSNGSHDIANDFNYDFFKIGNTYDSRENSIEASMPCEIIIRYFPVIKDIP